MLLTRDNVLKFVRSQKYVTPTQVAKEFDVVTTIASAALSELVKDTSLKLTFIKYGTTPYYYDPLQKECLIEIAQKSFSGNELALFEKIKEQQIVSKNSLTIPEQVIINKLQDILYELAIEHQGREYVFLVWFLRDKKDTLSQIKSALSGNSSTNSSKVESKEKLKINKAVSKETNIDDGEGNTQLQKNSSNPNSNLNSNSSSNSSKSSNPFENMMNKSREFKQESSSSQTFSTNTSQNSQKLKPENVPSSNQSLKEHSIEQSNTTGVDSYLHQNGFKIIEKEKHILGSVYKTQVKLYSNTLRVDCISIEQKKVQIRELMEFYTSSMCPKYIFYTNLPKKIQNVFEELDNCFLVELKEL